MLSLPNENDVVAGKYRVERIIGRGGMGVVVAAWHLELDQRVALKFLLPDLVERGESAERFRREARAAARIKSEHVARVLDVGNWEGNAPYMVMEYLDGRDLGSELRDRGSLPIQDCVDYVLQAIEAVAEAHALGIVHRDLKPENLFLARRVDGSRTIKVLDFGISKSIVLGSVDQPSLTRTSTIMGSPFYMSPEQMRTPRNVDVRSDIWALGAILYDLIGGQPPYVAETIPQLCALMLESDPAPLRQLRPEMSPDLETVVAGCLVKDMGKRYSSVAELAQALLPFGRRSSRVHAERAGRVLSTSGSRPPDVDTGMYSSVPPAPPKQGIGPNTPTQASVVPTPTSSPQSSTQDSWGGTHPASPSGQNQAPPARTRPRTFFLAGAGLAVAGIALALLTRVGSSSEPERPVAPVLAPSHVGLPPEPTVQAQHPSSPAAAPPTAQELVLPPSETAPSAASAAPIDSSKAPMLGALAAKKPVPSHLSPAPSAPKPVASGLTDFGGRR